MSNKKVIKHNDAVYYSYVKRTPQMEEYIKYMKSRLEGPNTYIVLTDKNFGKKGISYDIKSYNKPDPNYYTPIL